MVTINVDPQEVLSDEKVAISVRGLESFQRVTLCAVLENEEQKMASVGTYVANEEGVVDLQRDTSMSGTYIGVEQMGLFWSMVHTPGQRDGLFFVPQSALTPEEIKISLFPEHLNMEQIFSQCGQVSLADTVFYRWYKDKSVEKLPVETGRFKGFLFLPRVLTKFSSFSRNERLAGILDLMGLFGKGEHVAALLASRGFAVLGVTIPPIPFSTFTDFNFLQDGVEWLSNHPRVRGGGVGVMGVSRNGEIALTMATYMPQVKACVSINGLPFYVHPALRHPGDTDNTDLCWNKDLLQYTENGVIAKEAFMFSEDQLNSQIIQVWRGDAKILLVISQDDQFYSPELYKWFLRKFPLNRKDDIQTLSLEGAGHVVDIPFRAYVKKSWHPRLGIMAYWGGEAKTHSRAEELFWLKLQTFFRDSL